MLYNGFLQYAVRVLKREIKSQNKKFVFDEIGNVKYEVAFLYLIVSSRIGR